MKAVILLAEGFEEIESIVCFDVLKRAGIEVFTAGTHTGVIPGSHGLKVIADTTIDKIDSAGIDAVIVP